MCPYYVVLCMQCALISKCSIRMAARSYATDPGIIPRGDKPDCDLDDMPVCPACSRLYCVPEHNSS